MQAFLFLQNWQDADIARKCMIYKIKKMRESYPVLLTLAEREADRAKKQAEAMANISMNKEPEIDYSRHINYNE